MAWQDISSIGQGLRDASQCLPHGQCAEIHDPGLFEAFIFETLILDQRTTQS